MTQFASQKQMASPSAPSGSAPPRASPVGGRSANKGGGSSSRTTAVSLAGQADLPLPKGGNNGGADSPAASASQSDKPVKVATWSAGPKRRQYQRSFSSSSSNSASMSLPPSSSSSRVPLSTGLGISASAHADHLEDYEPTVSSRNSRVSINHLLNFRLPPRQQASSYGGSYGSGRRSTGYGGSDKLSRERYLNANNRFVVLQDGNYEANLRDPDAAVDWTSVVQVLMPTPPNHAPTCPICLSHPVAPKCTQCGHVYCYPCILRHLSVSEKGNRRCPVCFDEIRERELRSVSFVMLENQTQASSPTMERADGKGTLELTLMHRMASSTLVLPANTPHPTLLDPETGLPTAVFPFVTDTECARYAKLLLASPAYVAEHIYEHEAMALERILQDNTDLDALERKYLEMARDTSLGRMHAIGQQQQQQSGSGPGGIMIPGKGTGGRSSSAASTPVTTPQSSFGSPRQQGGSVPVGPGDRYFQFYQASDGSHVYLHPLDIRILKQEFGDYSAFPPKISARVQEYEEGSVNSDLRKRFRYLGHLPLGSDVTFAEVVLDGLVAEETLSSFRKELASRDDRRAVKRRQQKEEEDRQARDARRLQRIQLSRHQEGITAPLSAVGLADLEPDDEPVFDMSDVTAALSTSPTYVPPTPMLSFARAIASPQAKAASASKKVSAASPRISGRGQPPPSEFVRGITIGHEMGRSGPTRPTNPRTEEDDDVDEDSMQYLYNRPSSRSSFGLLTEDDRLQCWSFDVQEASTSSASAEAASKKKGKGKKIVLVSNGGARGK